MHLIALNIPALFLRRSEQFVRAVSICIHCLLGSSLNFTALSVDEFKTIHFCLPGVSSFSFKKNLASYLSSGLLLCLVLGVAIHVEGHAFHIGMGIVRQFFVTILWEGHGLFIVIIFLDKSLDQFAVNLLGAFYSFSVLLGVNHVLVSELFVHDVTSNFFKVGCLGFVDFRPVFKLLLQDVVFQI